MGPPRQGAPWAAVENRRRTGGAQRKEPPESRTGRSGELHGNTILPRPWLDHVTVPGRAFFTMEVMSSCIRVDRGAGSFSLSTEGAARARVADTAQRSARTAALVGVGVRSCDDKNGFPAASAAGTTGPPTAFRNPRW